MVGVLLPAFDLSRDIFRQMVPDFRMQVRKALRLHKDAFPSGFRCPVFRSCLAIPSTSVGHVKKRHTHTDTDKTQGKIEREKQRTYIDTFLDEIVPFSRPRPQTFGVVLLDFGSVRHQLNQFCAQSVAVFDAFRRSFIIARLPKRPARRRQQVLLAVMRHLRRA